MARAYCIHNTANIHYELIFIVNNTTVPKWHGMDDMGRVLVKLEVCYRGLEGIQLTWSQSKYTPFKGYKNGRGTTWNKKRNHMVEE